MGSKGQDHSSSTARGRRNGCAWGGRRSGSAAEGTGFGLAASCSCRSRDSYRSVRERTRGRSSARETQTRRAARRRRHAIAVCTCKQQWRVAVARRKLGLEQGNWKTNARLTMMLFWATRDSYKWVRHWAPSNHDLLIFCSNQRLISS